VGNRILVDTPTGERLHFEYDARGLVTRRSSEGSAPGLSIDDRYGYDGLGRMTVARNTKNGSTRFFSYDALDRAVAMHDPALGSVRQVFDADGRIVQIGTPDGTSVHYGYSARGEVTSVRDPAIASLATPLDERRARGASRGPRASRALTGRAPGAAGASTRLDLATARSPGRVRGHMRVTRRCLAALLLALGLLPGVDRILLAHAHESAAPALHASAAGASERGGERAGWLDCAACHARATLDALAIDAHPESHGAAPVAALPSAHAALPSAPRL
jgi:YD repeat-containing protein